MSIDRCALSGPDLGEIALTFKLVKADAAFWTAIDEGDTLALLGTKAGLARAKLVSPTSGLLERALEGGRRRPAASALAAVRAMASPRRCGATSRRGVLITEDLTKLLDTVARFIESGGTLTLDAKPDPPLGIDKLELFSAARPRPGEHAAACRRRLSR